MGMRHRESYSSMEGFCTLNSSTKLSESSQYLSVSRNENLPAYPGLVYPTANCLDFSIGVEGEAEDIQEGFPNCMEGCHSSMPSPSLLEIPNANSHQGLSKSHGKEI